MLASWRRELLAVFGRELQVKTDLTFRCFIPPNLFSSLYCRSAAEARRDEAAGSREQ